MFRPDIAVSIFVHSNHFPFLNYSIFPAKNQAFVPSVLPSVYILCHSSRISRRWRQKYKYSEISSLESSSPMSWVTSLRWRVICLDGFFAVCFSSAGALFSAGSERSSVASGEVIFSPQISVMSDSEKNFKSANVFAYSTVNFLSESRLRYAAISS